MSLYHSDIGPWGQFAGLVLRTDRRIDIQIWNDPEVTAYRVWGSPNPDDLYGNPAGSGVGGTIANRQMMFQVTKGQKFISPGLRRKGFGVIDESMRGTTRALFDLAEYGIAAPNGQMYVAVQQVRNGVPLVIQGYADGTAQILGGCAAGDIITIAGVPFTAVNPGPANPALQQFDDVAASGSATATATSLVAAINDPASQALLLAAVPVGVTVAADNAGGTSDTVTITASVLGTDGELVTLAENTAGARVTLSGAALALPANVGLPVLGPTLVIPNLPVMWMPEGTVVISGTSPDFGVVSGDTPDQFNRALTDPNGPPYVVVLPRPTTSITVRNLDAGGVVLAASFGWSQPYVEIPAGGEITTFGSVKEIFVSSGTGGGNPAFAILANLGLGAKGGV